VQLTPIDRAEQRNRGEALLTGQPRTLIEQRHFHDLLCAHIVAPPQQQDAPWILNWKRPDQNSVRDAEDRGDASDRDAENQQHRRR
jgi:hypothetical protein